MPPILLGNLTIWLTPVWLLSVGVAIGAVILLLLSGLLWVISRPAANAVPRFIQESVLQPISYIVMAFVLFAVLGGMMMPVGPVLESLRRLPQVGSSTQTVTIPAHQDDFQVSIRFRSDELQGYSLESEQDLVIGVEPGKAYSHPLLSVQGNELYAWKPSSKTHRLFNDTVDKLYVTNESDLPTKLTINITTDVLMPEVHQIPITAAAVVAVYVVYLLLQWLLPGLSAIAFATAKEAVAQPLYLLATLGGAFALLLYIYIPYNTFGEDVKMLKDSGLTTITVLAILVGLWTASVSVADEIEGRTALTLLSKPISRRQFVLGKFLGIVWALFLLFVVLGVILLITISYKVVYDARETANPDPNWQLCYAEMIGTVPGLVLAFLETVMLTAISVAISTRLPMLPNLVICGAIYVLGHLGPLIVQSSAGQMEYVAFIGRLIALVLPVLDHFNIQAAVAGGVPVPMNYLGWAVLYCVLYSTVAMLLALILFEDRDLA
ncbi:MAG: ABC transporter permease [Planctomycetes bacterium]|nr:ABC transporter permease [Planctomycetota bacterium]